jgi:hypothetical protein
MIDEIIEKYAEETFLKADGFEKAIKNSYLVRR